MFSQNNMTEKEVKAITSKGKKAIVEIAIKQLDKEVDTSYFKSIKVMASDNDVYVSFDNPIKFVPENSVYYYSTIVHIKGLDQSQLLKNPENIDVNFNEVQFLKYDDAILDKIKFVIKAISKQEVVETIDWHYYEDYRGMVIYDRGDHYYVDKSYGKFNEAAYTINKKMGITKEEYHAELVPAPDGNDVKYVEIKK